MSQPKLFQKYRPHAEQQKFHKSKARFKALTAGVRAGKTYGAAREFIRKIRADRKRKKGILKYWVVAPTFELADVALKEIATILNGGREALAPVSPSRLVKSWNASKRILVLKGGNVVIKFKSGHDPRKLVAEGLDGLWMDEPARMKPEAWRGALRQRLSDRVGWTIFSTTPLGTNNWYYTDIYQRGNPDSEIYDPNYENFHFKTVDNTAVPELVEEVKRARKELPEVYFKREYEASFDDFVGQIYEELNPRTHLYDALPSGIQFEKFVAGMDFGWKMGALVILGKTYEGQWYLMEEILRTHTFIAAEKGSAITWADELVEVKKRYRNIVFWCDSEDPEAIALLRRAEVHAMKAEKAVMLGIQRVAVLFHVQQGGEPRLKVHKSCTKTWFQLKSYRWDERQGEVYDKPALNQDDHAPDALRYALYSDFKKGHIGQGRQVAGYG